MIATAELVVPKSIPMTGPLTFLSASSAYLRTNDEPSGVRRRVCDRVADDVALGRALDNLEANIFKTARVQGDY
jgi:hypothetical protein